jgi:hypothetical protein
MSIVSSVFAVSQAQNDGRAWVRETHTDNVSIAHIVDYLAAAGADYTAIMTARAPKIALAIAEAEYLIKVNTDATPLPLLYQTGAEFADRFRSEYKDANQVLAAMRAYWIIERINAGDLTDLQVRTAFGMTTTQYNSLKSTKLTPQHDFWVGVLAAVGQ